MKYPEDRVKAANYLKQALPHLVKHEIAANPINYTLWYNYVGNRIPALNKALDNIINYSGTCTYEQSQELYYNYIIDEYLEGHQQTLEDITKLAEHIVQRLGKSANGSTTFDQKLSKNIKELKKAKTVTDITDIVDDIISASEDIRFANDVFRQQMEQATDKITSLSYELQQAERHIWTLPVCQTLHTLSFKMVKLFVTESFNVYPG